MRDVLMFHRLRKFLKSRDLFRNWFSAGLKYVIAKYGFVQGDIDVVFRCGFRARMNLNIYGFFVSNSGLMRLLSCSDGVWFRYGEDSKLVDLGFLGDGVFIFNYLGREVRLFLDDFPYFLHDILFENFFGGAYDD